MTFDEKLSAARKLLASKGLPRASYAPTLVDLLWRSGFRIPPPHFAGFWGTFAFSGTVFGVAWGVLMWFAFWSRHGTSASSAVAVATAAGAVAGLAAAGYYRHSARKYSIPAWDRFDPSGTRG